MKNIATLKLGIADDLTFSLEKSIRKHVGLFLHLIPPYHNYSFIILKGWTFLKTFMILLKWSQGYSDTVTSIICVQGKYNTNIINSGTCAITT